MYIFLSVYVLSIHLLQAILMAIFRNTPGKAMLGVRVVQDG